MITRFRSEKEREDPGNEIVNAHDLIKFATDRNRNAA